jgi:hypothetical protein
MAETKLESSSIGDPAGVPEVISRSVAMFDRLDLGRRRVERREERLSSTSRRPTLRFAGFRLSLYRDHVII